MKKILHIMTRYLGGGSETYVNYLLDNLPKEKYNQQVGFGKECTQEAVEELVEKDISIKQFKNLCHFNPLRLTFSIVEIYKYLKKNNFDIVHTHQTEAGIAGRIAASLYRLFSGSDLKIIHTLHAIPFPENRNKYLNYLIKFFEGLVFESTDDIIAISDPMKVEYCDGLKIFGYERNRVRVIPCGINRKKFRNAKSIKSIKEKYKDYLRLVMVSRITKGKGFEKLIDLVYELYKEYPNIKLKIFIVGDGEEEYKNYLYDKINNYKINDYFEFLSYRKDVSRIMKSCNAFILLSEFEGTPWTIYEAMASGLPIITTNVGSIPWQTNHDALFIARDKISSYKETLIFVLSDSKYRKILSEKSIKRSKEFTIEKMVKSIENVYDTVYFY